MMNLYIETNNGTTVNHPAFENNLIQAFGAVPDHWEPFVRVERPIPTVYQVLDSQESTYEKVNGVWTDVWALRSMTAEEIAAKQQSVKDNWAATPGIENYSTWVFDEATCSFVPPVPYPETGVYRWSGADNNWIEIPQDQVEIGVTRV